MSRGQVFKPPYIQRFQLRCSPLQRIGDEIERLEGVAAIAGGRRINEREARARGIGFEREMSLAKAGCEAGAEDLHLAVFTGQPELDRVPLEP